MASVTRPAGHKNQDVKKAQVFIPPDRYNIRLTVTVLTHRGTTITLTNYNSISYVSMIEWTKRSLSKGFGDATITLQNPLGIFNSLITGGEVVTILADYGSGTTASRTQIKVKVDAPLKSFSMNEGFKMILHCRQLPEVQDKFVSSTAESISGYTFTKQIIDNNYSTTLTYTNMSSSMSTILTRQYSLKYGGQVLNEIFDKCGFTGYVDSNGDVHSWSLLAPEKNADEFIAYGVNCTSTDSCGTDLRNIKNNIITTGDRVDGKGNLFYIWSKRKNAHISQFWQKDILINDNTINTQAAVEADTQLAYDVYTRTDDTGSLTSESYGLVTLEPGQSIRCYVPHCGIDGEYVAHEVKHTINPSVGSWQTTVTVQRKSISLIDFLKVRDDRNKGNVLASDNAHGMIGGYVVDLTDTSILSLTNVEIIGGVCKLLTGFGTGSIETDVKVLDEDVVAVQIRLSGSDLAASTVDVTADGGVTWETGIGFDSSNEYIITSDSINKNQLAFKINIVLDSDNPEPILESAECLFRYSTN